MAQNRSQRRPALKKKRSLQLRLGLTGAPA